MNRSWVQYCSWNSADTQEPPYLAHIYPTARLTRMCGGNPAFIAQVTFMEDVNGSYCGWLPAGATELQFIRPNISFQMQFPEKISVYEDKNEGKRVFLTPTNLTYDFGGES